MSRGENEPLDDDEYNDPNKQRERKEFFQKHRKGFGTLLFDETRECPVCLKEFNENETVIQLGCSAGHIYHESCLNELMRFSIKCVVCGEYMQEELRKREKEREAKDAEMGMMEE